ncbi:MAG: hypothetical protein ACLFO2_03300 [Candidatus Woesearchaeota archaeon]
MYLSNDRGVLQQLHDMQYIDLFRPVWMDFRYVRAKDGKSEPREFLPFGSFVDNLKVSELPRMEGDVPKTQSFFIPPSGDGSIPLTEVDLELYSLDKGVRFLAMACPLDEEQVSEQVGIRRDPLNFAAPKKLSTERLEEIVQGSGKERIFSPHISGVALGRDYHKFLYFPFRLFNDNRADKSRQEWNDSQYRFFEEVENALDVSGLSGYGFIPRNPSATLANRVRDILPDLYEMGVIASTKDFKKGKRNYKAFAHNVRTAKFESARTVTLGGSLEQVSFLDLVDRYEGLKDGSEADFSSYYPLTIPDFGEGHLSEMYGQTLPVALKPVRYRHHGSDLLAIGNHGLFVDDGGGEMTVAPWTDEHFAAQISIRLAELFSAWGSDIPVIPHYRRKGVKGRNNIIALEPREAYSSPADKKL